MKKLDHMIHGLDCFKVVTLPNGGILCVNIKLDPDWHYVVTLWFDEIDPKWMNQ